MAFIRVGTHIVNTDHISFIVESGPLLHLHMLNRENTPISCSVGNSDNAHADLKAWLAENGVQVREPVRA